MADRGLFPAIDVLRSVSRLMGDIVTQNQLDGAAKAREALAVYGEAADLIQIGAYVAGSDARIDAAKVMVPRIEALIKQGLMDAVPRAAALAALAAAVGAKA
jgi:flagellum-specific ATP synthase